MLTKKILIVDDDIWVSNVLTKILMNLGYSAISVVHNGLEAVAAALEYSPHLIFLDLIMPEIDGLTVLKMLKKVPALASAKVVICTASGDINNITKAISFGASDFISKPFTTETIKQKLSKLLPE